VSFVEGKLSKMPPTEKELGKVAREIANETIYGKNVKDNITVIMIALNRELKSQ
jgi:hypothetical protein